MHDAQDAGALEQSPSATLPPADPWTAERVAERLIEAFRLMPCHPVFSGGGRFAMLDAPEASDALAWPSRSVGDGEARIVLMTWARCRAVGESVRERYRDLGWTRTRADQRRRAALKAITEGPNAGQSPQPAMARKPLTA